LHCRTAQTRPKPGRQSPRSRSRVQRARAGGPVARPPLARVGAGLWPDRFPTLRRARLGVCFQGCGARAWGEAAKAARNIYKALRAATASDFEILSPKRGFPDVATGAPAQSGQLAGIRKSPASSFGGDFSRLAPPPANSPGMIRTSDRSIRVPAQPRSAELNPRGPTFGAGSSACSTVPRACFWARRLGATGLGFPAG
jgi:hypothetical protein